MQRGIIITALVLLVAIGVPFAASVPAAATDTYAWTWESPLPQGNILFDVSALDSTHAWAVGEFGTIIFRNAVDWTVQDSGTSHVLYGVSAYDATHVWAVGDEGTILFFNGTTWTEQLSGVSACLESVFAVASNDVLAVGQGGVILRFNGTTWNSMVSGSTAYLNGVYASSSTSAWAVGAGGIVLHYNGTNWSTEDSKTSENLRAVSGFEADNVWAVGEQSTIIHRDATEWAVQGTTASGVFDGVTAIDSTNVFAVLGDGTNGEVWHFDGGLWTKVSEGWTMLLGISGYDASSVFAVGLYGEIIFSNAVDDWTSQLCGTTEVLNGIFALDSTHAWALGESGTLMAYDGASWNAEDGGVATDLNDAWGSSATSVWAVGALGTVTYFNGTLWTDQGLYGEDLNAVSGSDSNHFWAVGDSGTIKFCHNGSWSDQACPGVTANLRSVHAVTESNVWAVGDTGTLIHYDGSSWSSWVSGTGENLNGVSALDANNVWVVGGVGTILHYNGSSWGPETAPTGDTLYDVAAVDANHVWGVGVFGTIVFRDGSSWTEIPEFTGNVLHAVSAFDSNDVWANGVAGTIVHGTRTVPSPHIDSLSAPAAYPGSSVILNGSGFGDTRGTGHVHFGSFAPAAGDYVAWSDTAVQVRTPAGAHGAAIPITVDTGGGSSNAMSFYVAPYITNVSPTWGNAGSTYVTLTGKGFGPARLSNSSVWFGSSKAITYSSWSNTSVRALVGAGAQGQAKVKMSASCCWSNARAFDVRPVITSITPSSGAAGTTITISGSAFCNVQGAGLVCFGSTNVSVTSSWKQSQIKVQVPYSLAAGAVQVKVYTLGGMSNGKTFTKT